MNRTLQYMYIVAFYFTTLYSFHLEHAWLPHVHTQLSVYNISFLHPHHSQLTGSPSHAHFSPSFSLSPAHWKSFLSPIHNAQYIYPSPPLNNNTIQYAAQTHIRPWTFASELLWHLAIISFWPLNDFFSFIFTPC